MRHGAKRSQAGGCRPQGRQVPDFDEFRNSDRRVRRYIDRCRSYGETDAMPGTVRAMRGPWSPRTLRLRRDAARPAMLMRETGLSHR
uniref:Uncharacterized protein n=1 Tax=uncultured marine virus TaxID=186617 RepID=A0A0F7L243_9VIRU|nr:hypothetical protein sce8964 [uncultured marine virus]